MPNWCYTIFEFRGAEHEIKHFYRNLKMWTNRSFCKTDFGDEWLGNVLIGAGLGHRIDGENAISCRGSIAYFGNDEPQNTGNTVKDENGVEFKEFSFKLETETAWGPKVSMWSEVFKKLDYTTIDFAYIAEEPGNELYMKRDPFGNAFEEDFIVEIGDIDLYEDDKYWKFRDFRERWCYGVICEAVIKELQSLLDSKETDFEKLANIINNSQDIPIQIYTLYVDNGDFSD